MKNYSCLLFFILLLLVSCRSHQAKTYDFPKPVDTTDKVISLQEKKVYRIEAQGVFADNLFDGARLNDFEHEQDDLYQVTISPENTPINKSPYYAFRIWGNNEKSIRLELNYVGAKHRYSPKISKDGKNWENLAEDKIQLAADSINAFLSLDISTDTLWVAAQEVQNSTHVGAWCQAKARHPDVVLESIGKSKLGKDLWCLDVHDGEVDKKDVIVIMSRQHPPEVTGYFAMQVFLDEILANHPVANDFRKKYRILVFPLMNPDGVDLGHWRHNAGGVDLNRDWAYYHQPENRQVANYIVRTSKANKSKVIMGLDFHSTWYDVYYTNKAIPKHLPYFKDYWLHGIQQSLGEETNEKPSNLGGPVSKNWFLTQFGAVGVTYEIGDETPRDFIQEKGKVSAAEMMKLLMFKE